jgi:hypothetical protein
MRLCQFGKSKDNPDKREKYSLTIKKIKTTSFLKYWNDNILDRLGSNQVNLANLLPRSWELDNTIEKKIFNSILNQPNVKNKIKSKNKKTMTRVDPGEETIELHRKKKFKFNSWKMKLKQNSIKKEKNSSQPS